MMEILMFAIPWLLVLSQTTLLVLTQRQLRAANKRTDSALKIADEWRVVAGRFEDVAKTWQELASAGRTQEQT